MRFIGWIVSFVLSLVAYVPLIGLYTPIGKMLELDPYAIPFIDVFTYLLIGIIIFGGGSILIAFLWLLIWKPFD